jgi:hypothetical protein
MQEQLKKATAEKNKAQDKAKGEEAAAAKAAPVAAPTPSKPKGWNKLRSSIVKAKSTTSMDGKPENVRRIIVHAPAPGSHVVLGAFLRARGTRRLAAIGGSYKEHVALLLPTVPNCDDAVVLSAP